MVHWLTRHSQSTRNIRLGMKIFWHTLTTSMYVMCNLLLHARPEISLSQESICFINPHMPKVFMCCKEHFTLYLAWNNNSIIQNIPNSSLTIKDAILYFVLTMLGETQIVFYEYV